MTSTTFRKFAAIAIATTLIGGAILALPASAADAAVRNITVSAEGSVKVTPDAVRLDATVSNVSPTSKEALAAAGKAASAFRAALKAASIATKDIASQSITVYPEYNYTQDKGQSLIGYRASQTFQVTIRNAANAGTVVDAVVAATGDALTVNGVSPFVLDSTKASLAARADAVKKAKAKATSYASLLGVKLGKVNYLTEGSAPSTFPVYAMAKAADGATEVDLGQQSVTVSVTVQWGLL